MNEKLPAPIPVNTTTMKTTTMTTLDPPLPLPLPLPLPPIDTENVSTYHITAMQVPLEFGGTLRGNKSSKNNSNQQSPQKKSRSNSGSTGLGNNATGIHDGDGGGNGNGNGDFCTCFAACGYGNRNRIAIPFWPAVLANLGICALLIGYIFIGSFIFLTIENTSESIISLDSNAPSSWRMQHTAEMPQIIQQQQQQQQQQHLQQQTTSGGNQKGQRNNSSLETTLTTQSRYKRNSSGTRHMAESTESVEIVSTSSATSVAPEVSAHIKSLHGETKLKQNSIVVSGTTVDAGTGAGSATLEYELQTLPLTVNDVGTVDYMGDDGGVGGSDGDSAAITFEDAERQRTVESIWDITVSLNILYKENWTRLAALEIAKFQDQLVKRLVMDLTLSTANGATQSTSATAAHGHNTKQQQQQQQTIGSGIFGLGNYERQRFWHTKNTQQQNQRPNQWWWSSRQNYGASEQRRRGRSEKFEWNFATAFLYSTTVITTVGYGTITARTTLGRMVTIGYATLGIPLTLIYLSSVGNVLAKVLRYFCSSTESRKGGVRSCCLTRRRLQQNQPSSNGSSSIFNRHPHVADRKTELKLKHFQQPQPYCYVRPPAATAQEMEMQQHSIVIGGGGGGSSSGIGIGSSSGGIGSSGIIGAGGSTFDNLSIATSATETTTTTAATLRWSLAGPVVFCIMLLILYVTFGAVVVALLEDWPLIDGIYFCFMSLSTIGFCDLLPGIDDGSVRGSGSGGVSVTGHNRRSSVSANITVWFCAAYILSGLTITSMCVNLLHDEIAARMRVVVKFEKVHEMQNEQRDGVLKSSRS